METVKRTGWLWTNLAAVLFMCACRNYYIPKDMFISQFSQIDSSDLRRVTVLGPMGSIMEYYANPINYIQCVDKEGSPSRLANGPSIESRITIAGKKRQVFYFDRFIIKDSILYGVQSRFLELKASIPLSEITKIEVQNGQKNFRYIKVEPR